MDGDGIGDGDDGCPNEPEDKDGFQDTDGCPDLDHDGDQVPDTEDLCPAVAGVPEADGCPDADADGIADEDDKCPNEAENKNGIEDADGCPDELPAHWIAWGRNSEA